MIFLSIYTFIKHALSLLLGAYMAIKPVNVEGLLTFSCGANADAARSNAHDSVIEKLKAKAEGLPEYNGACSNFRVVLNPQRLADDSIRMSYRGTADARVNWMPSRFYGRPI